MTRFLTILFLGLSTITCSACEQNVKRPLEMAHMPASKKIRLLSYVDKDQNGTIQKVRLKLFFDRSDINNQIQSPAIGHTYNLRSKPQSLIQEEPEDKLNYARGLAKHTLNTTIDLLINEICATQRVSESKNIIVRMDNVLKRQEDGQQSLSEILEKTIWYLARKAVVHNIPKEHVLPFLFFYLKNDIDINGTKNSENKTLIEYAVQENCHSLAAALLQFNSELALKLQGKVSLITDEHLQTLKEQAQSDGMKQILADRYVPRSSIKVFLHRMNLLK